MEFSPAKLVGNEKERCFATSSFFVLLSIIVVRVNGIEEKHLDAEENVKWFIKPQFDDVWYFNEGLARVRKEWKYGFIN